MFANSIDFSITPVGVVDDQHTRLFEARQEDVISNVIADLHRNGLVVFLSVLAFEPSDSRIRLIMLLCAFRDR
jgi:hypothetical protein